MWPAEDRCWWAPFRTALPPDSVAAGVARAYTTLGLARVAWSHRGDTAWAEARARPEAVTDSVRRESHAASVLASRVVAIRRGDTTRFRTFVAIAPGTSNAARDLIRFCGEIMRAAGTAATAPRTEEPDDTLPPWRRRP